MQRSVPTSTSFGGRWRSWPMLSRLPLAVPGRQALVLGAIVVVSLALRILTWNHIADGNFARATKIAIVGAISSVLVWALLRVQTRTWVPVVAAVVVLLSGDAIHYVRLANPITRGGAVVSFVASFANPAVAKQQWDLETNGAGQARVENGALVLESAPKGTAYAEAQVGRTPDVTLAWWLPVGLSEGTLAERLTWTATVTRTGDFYVIADMDKLLIQAVNYGLHITYPDANKQRVGHEVQTQVSLDGQPHQWVLTRDGQQITLAVDGKQLWSAPQQGELHQLKLGETKVDPLHGGSMRIEAASYNSHLVIGQ